MNLRDPDGVYYELYGIGSGGKGDSLDDAFTEYGRPTEPVY